MKTVNLTTSEVVHYNNGVKISQTTFGRMSYNGSTVYYNARYKFHTPKSRATHVKLASNPNPGYNFHMVLADDTSAKMTIRYYITKDGDTPKKQGGSTANYTGTFTLTRKSGTDKKANAHYSFSGEADVDLDPDTDYYMFVFLAETSYMFAYLYSPSFGLTLDCKDDANIGICDGNGNFVKSYPIVCDGNGHWVKAYAIISDGSDHWVKSGG